MNFRFDPQTEQNIIKTEDLPPRLCVLQKIHKEDIPLRSIVSARVWIDDMIKQKYSHLRKEIFLFNVRKKILKTKPHLPDNSLME